MRKNQKKLVLSKETLLHLENPDVLKNVEGAYNTNPKGPTFSAAICAKTEWYGCLQA